MRDYGNGTEIIWDSDPDCAHEWGKEITRKQSGGTRTAGVTNNSDDRIHFAKKSNFCSKCGAWKGQLGLEPTFDLYIKHLCDIFDEVKRVLRKTGSCWVNLGDTYLGSWGAMSHDIRKKAKRTGYNSKPPSANFGPKCLSQIPSRFAIEMVNRGWILRNEIIWHKRNCMPSSVKDRFTVDFEKIFFFVKSRRYYFEQQFDPYEGPINRWGGQVIKSNTKKQKQYFEVQKISPTSSLRAGGDCRPHLEGRNKRCVWDMPTQPFPEAHFAVFPEALVETPIKAGCPEFICKKCAKPREKIFERLPVYSEVPTISEKRKELHASTYSRHRARIPGGQSLVNGVRHFVGYSGCGCGGGFEPGIVLDPFCGTGTTCFVAKRLGRRWIGIDINPDYCKMARRRLTHVERPRKFC